MKGHVYVTMYLHKNGLQEINEKSSPSNDRTSKEYGRSDTHSMVLLFLLN